jgi:hypothetical protein
MNALQGAASVGGLFHFRRTDIEARAQSSRLAEFGGRGMSFNICRGTLGCRLAVLIAAILHSRCGCPKVGTGAHGEAAVSELTPAQASEKCHKHLVAGLRLIRPAERVGAIAKALQELEAREKRRPASDAGPRFLDS